MTDEVKAGTNLEVPENMFKDVKYFLIGNIEEKVAELLTKGGAKRDHYLSQMVTHAIADDAEEEDCNEARDLFDIPVITSRWVILSVKCGCLLPMSGFSPEDSQPFSGVVACPSQIAKEDWTNMWGLITYNGGRCQLKLNKDVTHLVASKPSGDKYDCAMLHKDSTKIVTPDWITDCLEQKTKLDETKYHPRLLVFESDRKPIEPEPMETDLASDQLTLSLPRSPGSSSLHGRQTPPTSLQMGGSPSRTKEALARMVSHRLSGRSFETPQEGYFPPTGGPMPGFRPSLPLMPLGPRPTSPRPSSPRTASPRARSPRPSSPRGMLRNITNSGEPKLQRGPRSPRSPGRGAAKISQLVSSLSRPPKPQSPSPQGAFASQFPVGLRPMLNVPETAVYYGHDPSEKVPEDYCLLKCVFYITDYQKYLESSMIDAWKKVIEQYGGQVDDSYSNRITHILCDSQKSELFQLALRDGKRLVTAHWLNDVLVKKKVLPPWLALHFPSVYGREKPAKTQMITVTNFEGDEREQIKAMIGMIGARYTGYMTHANSVVIAKKPVGVKYQKALEWRIPVVDVQWLNDLLLGELRALKLPVNPRYQKFDSDDPFKIEMWRVAYLMEGWKVPIKISKEAWKKVPAIQRAKTPPASEDISPNRGLKRKAEDESSGPEKRLKIEGDTNGNGAIPTDGRPVVLITGLPRGSADALAAEITKLGGIVRSSFEGCTHVVAPSIKRTVKFLTALSVVRYIVSPDWVQQSMLQGRFVDESEFPLKDAQTEAAFNFSLPESLNRARLKPVFQDLTFYITPDVTPSRKMLQTILTNAGGTLVDKRPSVRNILGQKTPEGEPTFIVISCDEDLHLCEDLTRRKIAVHYAEFILTGVLKQEVDHESHKIS